MGQRFTQDNIQKGDNLHVKETTYTRAETTWKRIEKAYELIKLVINIQHRNEDYLRLHEAPSPLNPGKQTHTKVSWAP